MDKDKLHLVDQVFEEVTGKPRPGKGRPGGNPDLVAHQFTVQGDEPLASKQLQIRLPESIQKKLDEMPAKVRNEFVRQLIIDAVRQLP